MSSSVPFKISINPDPALIIFAGKKTDSVNFEITNADTRNITSLLIRAVRADLMPLGLINNENRETKLAAGESIVFNQRLEARATDFDEWTSCNDWSSGLDLGEFSPGQSKTFQIRLNLLDEQETELKQGFSIMLAII